MNAPTVNALVKLNGVRLSFPHLAEPQRTTQANGNVRVSHNASFIMKPDDPGFQAFWQAYTSLAVEKWKEHAQTVMSLIQNDRKLRCYGQGSEVVNKTTFKVYAGYEGMVYITAGRDQFPQVIDATGRPIDPTNTAAIVQELRRFYGGCCVNAVVRPWLQENQYGRGVRCDLIAVQFAHDDQPFGEGTVDASDLFAPVQQAAAPQAAMPGASMPAAPFPQPAAPAAPVFPAFMMPQ